MAFRKLQEKILSDAAGAGCHLRSVQWSFIVLLSGAMLQRGVSGGLANRDTCQGVRVWTESAGQTGRHGAQTG